MKTALSSKGQVVIPRQIRLNRWKSGVSFSIIKGDTIVLKPTLARKITAIEEVIGCAGYSGHVVSLADI